MGGSQGLGQKPGAMRFRRLLLPLLIPFLTVVLVFPALADGLIASRAGGGVLLDSDTLSEVGRFQMGDNDVPLLAVHPTAPILAAHTPGEGLVFWNLPQCSEASRHQNALLGEGVVSLEFSRDGERLYLLSSRLRAVLVFELASSKIITMIPVPGGEPTGFGVGAGHLLVTQGSTISVLSTDPKEGLVAQFRFPEEVLSGLLQESRVYVALRGVNGIWAYQFPTGRTLGLLPTSTEVAEIVERANGLVLSTPSGLESQPTSGEGQGWKAPSVGGAFDLAGITPDQRRVFALKRASGLLLILDSKTGAELGRLSLAGVQDIVTFKDPGV